MEIRFRVFGRRVQLRVDHLVRVQGITSKLPTGSHIVMWDFDSATWEAVSMALREVQGRYQLPTIYVVRTRSDGFHAYCYTSKSWAAAREIVEATPGVDQDWLRLASWRGYFTLRWTAKGRSPRLEHYATLRAATLFEVDPRDTTEFVWYWTTKREGE